MRIVCQQTILTKYHALFVIFEKAAKFEIVVCCKLWVALQGFKVTHYFIDFWFFFQTLLVTYYCIADFFKYHNKPGFIRNWKFQTITDLHFI